MKDDDKYQYNLPSPPYEETVMGRMEGMVKRVNDMCNRVEALTIQILEAVERLENK